MISPEYLDSLHSSLAGRAEDVCRMLLPGGKRQGSLWKCGGVDGGPGKSMSTHLSGEWLGVWIDSATGETGRLLKLFELTRGLKFKEAVEQAAEFCRMGKPDDTAPTPDKKIDASCFDFEHPEPAATPGGIPAYKAPAPQATVIDWSRCVSEFTAEKAAELCEWRGYSAEIVRWMVQHELIGCFRGCFAFPVHDAGGRVVALHYRGKEKGWFYEPKGAAAAPLIIGNPATANHTLAFESQWDAFAVLDKLEAHDPANAGTYAAYITRSATSNTDTSTLNARNLIACPQNDPREKANKVTGRTPSEEWLHRIQAAGSKRLAVFETPAPHKDANDWIRGDQPDHFDVFKLVIDGARNPILDGVKSTDEIRSVNTADDPNSMIGHKRRFLGKGGSIAMIGPSGIGKSTLIIGLAMHAAAGVPWHGITFRKAMKVLVVQAENDDGDLKEMVDGAVFAVGFDRETTNRAGRNIKWKRETSRTGSEFCQWLEVIIQETGAELVVIDPLLSYVGDDISQQKVASQFFRNWLQPVLDRTGAIVVLVHHTGKTPTDSKSRQNWSESDFAYLGIGSSELTNWARSVAVLVPHGVDTGRFRFLIAKRGSRAGMIDRFTGEKSTSIYLQHAKSGLGWVQCERPAESECAPRNGGRKQSLTGETVLKALGSAATMMRRDTLIADLSLKNEVSERTARERVDMLIMAGKIHVAESEPRKGGGRQIDWLRAGPSSIGNNQPETSK